MVVQCQDGCSGSRCLFESSQIPQPDQPVLHQHILTPPQEQTHSQPLPNPTPTPPPPSAATIHLLVLPVITVTTLNSCVFLGYGVQGEVGLPGDPGQPMVNGAVEFLGFPKGHKGIQVCSQNVKTDI